jgi:hypothetical protein
MKTFLPKTLLFTLCVGLSACAIQPLSTPSGRPEVAVRSSLSRTQNSAIEVLSSQGFSLISQSQNTLVFERYLPPAQSAVLLMGVGNSYHSQPKAVIKLTFVTVQGMTKVSGRVEATTQGPFGQIKSMDITGGKSAQELQATLETIKRRNG